MMKPKEALIQDGKVPTTLGRGRMSAEQKARCVELAAAGWKIEGFTVTSSATPDKPAVVAVAKPSTDVDAIPDPTFPESMWRVIETISKVKRGMRDCCDNCYSMGYGHRSLTYCICGAPHLIALPPATGAVAVTFVAK